MRRLSSVRAARDRGAAAVIIAILGPLVLLGIGAFVVDTGSWYSYRAQTQNAADAGAMAVAISCAAGTCNTSAANQYATANVAGNASDSLATSGKVSTGFPCGNGPGLPSCSSSQPLNCPAAPSGKYVNVHVETSKAVPSLLGQVFGAGDKEIGACAQASWGPPSGLSNAVALTISACEWLKNTNQGTSFATVPSSGYGASAPYYTKPPSYLATLNTRRSDPDYDTTVGSSATNYYTANNIKDPHNPALNAPIAGSETVITTHGFGNTCDAGNPGWAAPGQFGWLSKTTCSVPITGTTYTGTTGNTPAPCGPIFQSSLLNKTPIYLPVYTTTTLSGTNTVYTLDGFAGFVVTGWDVGGGVSQWNLNGSNVPTRYDSVIEAADQSPTSVLSSANKSKDAHYCGVSFTGSNSDVCIYGYFVKALIPASALPTGTGSSGGTDLGATAPYLTG